MEQLKNDTENRIIANLKLLEEIKIIIDTICSNVKDNVIFDELMTPLKRRLNDVYDNVRNTKIPVKQNDSKRYDILTPDGRIQLGLCALNRKQIHSMFDYEDNPAQILREIDEYNMIQYETEPIFQKEQYVNRDFVDIIKEITDKNDESEKTIENTKENEMVQDEVNKTFKNKKNKKSKKEQKNAKTTRKSST
jgi:hypothetical protein